MPKTTTITVERSQAEIKRMLSKIGAMKLVLIDEDDLGESQIVFVIDAPDGFRTMYQIRQPALVKGRTKKMMRRRLAWLATARLLEAKIDAILAGMTTIEKEFAAYTVLPDGSSLLDHHREIVSHNYDQGPPLLGFVK